jgi:putative sterol carrier protein
MFDPGGDVLAVLDWEMAILGDPECDLAFMITLDWLLSEGAGVPRLEGFPEKGETVKRYEELTGWKVENFSYNEVLATFRVGTIVLRVQKNLQKMGVALPGEDPILDNFCTRRLADLLDLPAPGASKTETIGKEALSGTVQLRLTGPGGGDWYIAASRGQATRHEGRVENPDATVTVLAEDWAAIRRGDMNPFNAWTSGRLKITGDDLLYRQLADIIAKAWD